MCGGFIPFNLEKQMATGFGLFTSSFLQAMTSRCIHQCLEGVKKPILVWSGSPASNAIEQEHYLLGIVLITEYYLILFAAKSRIIPMLKD